MHTIRIDEYFIMHQYIVCDIFYDKEMGIIKELDIGDRIQFPIIEPSNKITSDNPKTAIQSSDEIIT